jgi:acyl carrier protein
MSNNANVIRNTDEVISERIKVIRKVKEVLIHRLNLNYAPDDIPNDAVLFGGGLGLDSIDALQLVVGIEADFEVTLPQDQSAVLRSVNTVADYIIAVKHSGKADIETFIEDHALLSNHPKEDDYNIVRNEVGFVLHDDLAIYKINLSLQSLESVDKLLSGKVKQLSEDNILQSLILDESSNVENILAYVELFHCGDHLLILINKDNKQIIENSCMDAVDVSNQFDLFSLTGPKSTNIINHVAGQNVIGLRLHNHTLVDFESTLLRIGNISHTGESGFIFFSVKNITESLILKLESAYEQKLRLIDRKTYRLLQLESSEIGFDLSIMVPNHESPYSAGLSWMIDSNKYKHLEHTHLKKLVLIRGQLGDISIANNDKLLIKHQEIGHISICDFSPTLNKIIGYAYVDPQYAWPGVITDNNIQFVSAPFLLTKSFQSREG